MDIEHKSIEELNRELESGLLLLKIETTKGKVDRENIRKISMKLNDILYSTIIYHAPSVNAVQIQTSADLSKEYIRAPNWGLRGRLRDYIQKVKGQKELEGKVPFSFISHLPFSFTTGTHGSGERAAMGASYENIVFDSSIMANRDPSFLRLDLGPGGWLREKRVYFLPEEVDSVRLAQVDDSEFSPVYQDWEKPLKSSHSALEHYLYYKGFSRIAFSDEDIPESKWKKRILPLMRSVLIPEHSTHLLKRHEALISGFAAITTDYGVEVYEFDNFKLPEDLVKDKFHADPVAYVAYAIIYHRNTPQSTIKVYKRNDGISRLHEFKTERRF